MDQAKSIESVNRKSLAKTGREASIAEALTYCSYRHPAAPALATKGARYASGPRSGRTSLWALALLMALFLTLWVSNRSSENLLEIPQHTSNGPEVPERAPLSLTRDSQASSIELRADKKSAVPQSAARTDGIGSLRGVLLDRTGDGVPERWTLVMSPNTAIRTPTPRQELRYDFEKAEERFTVQDVPLGAYDVWIEAKGVNRRATPILLVRGSDSPFISLELHARGYLEGFVLDEPGAPVADIKVTIISTLGWESSTRTDGAGRYQFNELIDGEYQLLIGARQNPLVGPEEFSFQAPSLHYPVRRVPKLGSARIHAVDKTGAALVGIRVDGFAPDGGILGGLSDSDGFCLVNNLVPGRYRLSLRGVGDAAGQGVCFVNAGERVEIEIILRD